MTGGAEGEPGCDGEVCEEDVDPFEGRRHIFFSLFFPSSFFLSFFFSLGEREGDLV